MEGPLEETRELLEERPEFEPVIEEILELDAAGPWGFHDVSCDSGEFGELVSRDFVESDGDNYRLVERTATRRALVEVADAGEKSEEESETDEPVGQEKIANPDESSFADRINLDERKRIISFSPVLTKLSNSNRGLFAVFLTGALALLAVVRSMSYDSVFREDDVVMIMNDPWYYRYWVEQLVVASPGYFDFPAIADTLGSRATGEPLTHIIHWWITTLVGFGPISTGATVAIIPVIFAVLGGALTAWIAYRLTRDERIAVLSVFALAIMPANFLYTMLGFLEHSPLDFVYLGIMAGAMIWLAQDLETRRKKIDEGDNGRQSVMAHLSAPQTWAVAGLFGLVVGASMLTWNGAPLLLIGISVYAVAVFPSGMRVNQSPALSSLPLVGGLAFGSVVAVTIHFVGGLQELPVVLAPALVGAGTLGLALVAEGAESLDQSPVVALGGGIIAGIGSIIFARFSFPGIFNRYSERFFGDLLGREGIAETRGLFNPEISIHFGPFEQFGLLALFFLPALGYVAWRCMLRHEPDWLVLASFGTTFLVLATVQRRFAGELSIFAAILSGIGIVWLCSFASICRPISCFGNSTEPVRLHFNRKSATSVRAIVILVLVVVITAPSLFLATVSIEIVETSDQHYETAKWIEEDAGGDPAYVLSQWDRNRMYNYIVWGGGNTYSDAAEVHDTFLRSHDPDRWYENFTSFEATGIAHDRDFSHVDYVVIEAGRTQGQLVPDTAYGQLHQLGGTAQPEYGVNGSGHFQLAYVADGRALTVFRPVAGATITGSKEPGEDVVVGTEIDPEGVESFDYIRTGQADGDGTYKIRVAYPGVYATSTDTGPVEVTEEDVEDGNVVTAEE